MTTEQQEELLLGLRIEVLELKEKLADEYYNITQLEEYYVSDDELSSTLRDYLTDEQVSSKYKTITASDKKDSDLGDRIDKCVLTSDFEDYKSMVNSIDENVGIINQTIESLDKSLIAQDIKLESIYTKDEIDAMGFITEIPSLDYLASIEWVESKGYLTQHQSLDNYATINWVKSQLDSKEVNLYGYAKLTDLPTLTSELTNDSGFITEHQSLEGYAKTDDVNELKDDVSKVTTAFNAYVKNNGFITIKDVDNYVNLLNLEDTYAKKSDIKETDLSDYTTKTYVETKYAKITDIPDISLMYTSEYIDDNFESKTDLTSLLNKYVLKTDLTSYAKSSDLSTYVTKSYFSNIMDSYINDSNLEEIINNKLSSYVLKVDLDNYVKKSTYNSNIESNNVRLDNIEGKLLGFVSKESFDELDSKFISVNALDSYLLKEKAYNIIDEKLSNYVTKNDVRAFITYSDAYNTYVSKKTISSYIPDLTPYAKKSDLTSINGEIEDLTTDVLNNTGKITVLSNKVSSNYYTKSDIDTKISSIGKIDEILTDYAKKSDIPESADLTKYAKKSDVNAVSNSLINYAKLTDLPNTNNFVDISTYNSNISDIYTYIDSNTDYDSILSDYVKIDDFNGTLKTLPSKYVTYSELDKKLSYYFLTSNLHSYVDTYIESKIDTLVKNYINSKLKSYLSVREAADTYLAIEDYKYLKSAAVINDAYRDDYEAFYNHLYDSNGEYLKTPVLHNGFYVVEDQLYFVYNGKVMELDKIEYWKTEEE